MVNDVAKLGYFLEMCQGVALIAQVESPHCPSQPILTMKLKHFFCLSLFLGISAHGAPVLVDSHATGLFGSGGAPGASALVEGWSLASAGERVSISATGLIDLATNEPGYDTSPSGIGLLVDGIQASNTQFTPDEEKHVEAGTLILPRTASTTIPAVGALIAVFVPESVASAPGFSATNVEFGGAITPQDVFLVGSGPFEFTAQAPGRLYLGINDTFPTNNSGSFSVTVSAVPEPASVGLIIAAGAFMLSARRRCPSELR